MNGVPVIMLAEIDGAQCFIGGRAGPRSGRFWFLAKGTRTKMRTTRLRGWGDLASDGDVAILTVEHDATLKDTASDQGHCA